MLVAEAHDAWFSSGDDRRERSIVFIAEGRQLQYGSKALWDVVGR
jgi:hypothetical protein